jgi:soluble lytic murein transglycosylase
VSIATTFIHANVLTLDFFKDKPRSFMKDFYISQFLEQNIKPQEARELIGDVHNMNYKLFYKFADKVDDFSFTRIKYCKKLEAKHFKGKSVDCIALGLSSFKATSLSPKILVEIANLVKYSYPKLAQKYILIASKSFKVLLTADDKVLIDTFNSVGGKFRQTNFNHPIPAKRVNSLANEKSFSQMVVKIIRDPKLTKLQKSILKFDSSNLSADANFLLAINAIKHKKNEEAFWYLKLSKKKARVQKDVDKALFWSYLISKDLVHLTDLTKSKDINIYTLWANETLGVKTKGILKEILPKTKKAPFDVSSPFAWVNAKNSFKSKKYNSYEEKKLDALKLNSKETEPHVATLIYKFSLNEHYFFKPYFKEIKHLKSERIALILAIARQESRFIPTAVSYSYALGLMQFMPFVAKSIAQKNGLKDFKYEDIFNPKIAYKFANIHLDFLEKSLSHPLFVAYAYNGGIGFTRRRILEKEYFKEGIYEPYMSLEMVPNSQAREYGKKVLANYIIYAQDLGVDVTIKTLLNTLKPQNRNHHF